MANVILTTVYNFDTTGNKLYERKLMGLPSQGAFVSAVPDAARPDASVYVYSIIKYPNSAPGSREMNGFYTAESVSAIVTKMNA